MLEEPVKTDIAGFMEKAYALSRDQRCSGYPTFADGIKTKRDFEDTVMRAYEADNEKVLLFFDNGIPSGIICFYTLEDDKYLQTVIFSIETNAKKALREFEEYCASNYPGYEMNLGFPAENIDAAEYFAENQWELIEHSYHDLICLDNYQSAESTIAAVRVSEENYPDFRVIHDACQENMYWDSDRILETLDRWCIWLYYEEEKSTAAVYYQPDTQQTEIYGMDFVNGIVNPDAYRALMKNVFRDCKERNCKYVVFFHEDACQNLAIEMKFYCVGEYKLFRKRI